MTGENPLEQALFAQIEARRGDDPLIGAKIGAKEISGRLMAAFKNEKGVHIESLLCALGALAGYSCQAAVRAQARARSQDETSCFTIVQSKDGKRYFFGDRINLLLMESKHSVWSLAAAAAQQAGGTDLPNVAEIARHTATVLGSDAFGRPRTPQDHASGDLPINYARDLWPKLHPLIAKFCPDPVQWPVLLALCAQEAIVAGKSVLDPNLALRIVMEAAIPMSKVDLESGSKPELPVQPARPKQTRAPGTLPSRTTATAAGRRSKNWIVYALAIIVAGAWKLSRNTDSPRTIERSAPTSASATNVEAPKMAPPPLAPASPAPATSIPSPDSTATAEPEAEYVREERTSAPLPDVPPPALAADTSIEQLLRERKLRVATKSDYETWLRFAARNGIRQRDERAETYLALSRMYVVQAPLRLPADLYGAHSAAFIVMPGVPSPEGDPGHSLVMSMNR
jgi:hypothetical protein